MLGEKSNTDRHIPVIISYLPIAHFTVASQRTFVRLLHYEVLLLHHQVILSSNFRIKFETTLAIPFAINT